MDHPTLTFQGHPLAELFTRECAESLDGLCTHNLIREPGDLPAGFVHASPPNQGWSYTMWTRDAGVFLRELVLWGREAEARLVAGCLMDLVRRNEEGFLAFPEHFRKGQPGAGHEIDGTCAIVIGLVMLWERLDRSDPMRERIGSFLGDRGSPLDFLEHELAKGPLIAGTGEFGPGCGIHGSACNVVQNNLAVLAALAAARMGDQRGEDDRARRLRDAAKRIRDGMEQYLVAEDGSWIWCVDPVTRKPVPSVLEHPVNRGFGGINGVLSMYADVIGPEPGLDSWLGVGHCRRTFDRLLAWPQRREGLERWGLWTQFDVFIPGDTKGIGAGELTSPSYGHGYALQSMLLMDRMDMAGRALHGLAEHTFDKGQRRSPYYFYERMYAPPRPDAARHGCGELNLVCASEPLKCARLVLGLFEHGNGVVDLVPRLPAAWTRMEARGWPILLADGWGAADLSLSREGDGQHLSLTVRGGRRVADLRVRLTSGGSFLRRRFTDANTVSLNVPA